MMCQKMGNKPRKAYVTDSYTLEMSVLFLSKGKWLQVLRSMVVCLYPQFELTNLVGLHTITVSVQEAIVVL